MSAPADNGRRQVAWYASERPEPKGRLCICATCERERRHHAHGQCKTCYERDRAVNGRPNWLGACLECGRDWSQATYRSQGLCKTCERTSPEAERAKRRRFELARIDARASQISARAMVREAISLGGVVDLAWRLAAPAHLVRGWAKGRAPVPMQKRAALKAAWVALKRGELP